MDSIIKQVFDGSMEVIIVDDCSNDNTPGIIEEYKKSHTDIPIRIFYQEKNMKQGAARNRGLSEAKGQYIFFLDGDDLLDKNAFKEMIEATEKEEDLDFVLCDWTYYNRESDESIRFPSKKHGSFMENSLLEGMECERLLEAATYFTVNKLYKKDFLLKNAISYGEGYIYEDYEFYVQVSVHSERIAIINKPLYYVRKNENSTTKTLRDTTLHIDSLLLAVEHTLKKFKPRKDISHYFLYRYIMKKTMSYLRHRSPKGRKKETLGHILELLNKKSTTYPTPQKITPLYNLYFKKRLVQKKKIKIIIIAEWLNKIGLLKPLWKMMKSIKNKFHIN